MVKSKVSTKKHGEIELLIGHIYRWDRRLVKMISYTAEPVAQFEYVDNPQLCPHCGAVVVPQPRIESVINCFNMQVHLSPANPGKEKNES